MAAGPERGPAAFVMEGVVVSDFEEWRALTLGEVLDHLERVKEAHWQEGKGARTGPSGNNANRARRAALDAYEQAESVYVTLNRVAGYLVSIEAPTGSLGRCEGVMGCYRDPTLGELYNA